LLQARAGSSALNFHNQVANRQIGKFHQIVVQGARITGAGLIVKFCTLLKVIRRFIGPRSSRVLDPIGADQQIGRDFPRLTDLMNHVHRQRALAREELRGARA
jgi:hypothetical protein